MVLGATGYTGMSLIRLLTSHPDVDAIIAVSSSRAGTAVLEADPGLGGSKLSLTDGLLVSAAAGQQLKPDVVFSALPHLESGRVCSDYIGKSLTIDLAADYRIPDTGLFKHYYGTVPPKSTVPAIYGLSEPFRDAIRSADLIANPGCYPTAILLPLLPLYRANLLTGAIVCCALSGITGAGRKSDTNLLFAERAENTHAYSPGRQHRHWAELSYYLNSIAPINDQLHFIPHLVPIRDGIAATTICTLRPGVSDTDIADCYATTYSTCPFVRQSARDIPQTRDVRGSNRCDFAWHREDRQLFLFSAIDNLLKGAAGQAIQNMNLRLGLEETAGLSLGGGF